MGSNGTDALLLALGSALREARYRFVTVTPETQRRVAARATAAGRAEGRSLRDVFGWSRAFAPAALAPRLLELAREADVVREEPGGLLRATVRFSSLGDDLFVHSAYPTVDETSVFFGPDTYRFCHLLRAEACARATRVVDIGCGSGAGGIVAGRNARDIVLADVNRSALAFAAVNAALAGVASRTTLVESDVLARVAGPIDLVIANPPYMADPGARTYRDGGGARGADLAVRMVRESLARLEKGGRLILYTGAAVVDGRDTFLEAVRDVCAEGAETWRYSELDPDVFGEEIEQNEAYADVERIAAVSLVATAR